MDIIALLNDLMAKMAALQSALADAGAAADQIAKESYDKGYSVGLDKGFADGVASVPSGPPPSDKIFSQEEFDAKLAEALQPIKAELEGVKADLESVKASFEQEKANVVAAVKADLLAKYQEMIAQEQQAESGFGELLK